MRDQVRKVVRVTCQLCGELLAPADATIWTRGQRNAHLTCVLRASLQWRKRRQVGGKVLVFTRKSGPAFNPKGGTP